MSALEGCGTVAWGRAGDGGPARRPRSQSPAESSAPRQVRRTVVPQGFPRSYRSVHRFREMPTWGVAPDRSAPGYHLLPLPGRECPNSNTRRNFRV